MIIWSLWSILMIRINVLISHRMPAKCGMKLFTHSQTSPAAPVNLFNPARYDGCNYVCMLGLKLIHVKYHRRLVFMYGEMYITIGSLLYVIETITDMTNTYYTYFKINMNTKCENVINMPPLTVFPNIIYRVLFRIALFSFCIVLWKQVIHSSISFRVTSLTLAHW